MIKGRYRSTTMAVVLAATLSGGVGLAGVASAHAVGKPWMILHIGGRGRSATPLSIEVWRSGEAHAVGVNGMVQRDGKYRSYKVNRWFRLGSRGLRGLTRQRDAVNAPRLKSAYPYHGPPVLCGTGPMLIKLGGRWIHIQSYGHSKVPHSLSVLSTHLLNILLNHSEPRSHASRAAARAAHCGTAAS